MDPCPFVRILVGNLALKFLVSSKSSSSDCYCRIKLKNFPDQDAQIPWIQQQNSTQEPNVSSLSNSLAACFSFNKSQIEKILQENNGSSKSSTLMIDVYSGGSGASCVTGHKLLGRVSVPLDLRGADAKVSTLHNGWMAIGGNKKSSSPELYLTVKAEPDPRFVFQFGGEPECSPQVFQVQGSVKQAVFTCKFGFRNSGGDRNLVSRSSMNEPSSPRNWLPTFGGEKDQSSKERKGWSITVHDLSGSPVAMASMVTPFVPSPGSDRVSRSNPGAWLILRPGNCTWKPWGRLEAWREPGCSDALGYKFDLFQDAATTTSASTTVANSTLSCTKGGKFIIDRTTSLCATPVTSPHSSIDFGSGSWSGSGSGSDFSFCFLPPQSIYKGFVMSSTVGKSSKPEVEVGVQHVTCTEDAAAFVALAAAMDLSMDACRLFSQKLRKELRQQSQQCVV
ncbi:hypothetical protein Pint_33604 [Pistacia integerrima]|uniref:Uncharacterized protein n=1 Tax=Pistacia integerrima TaxID=434235 RepID=A0ACC0X5T2_9ROSI|nr:hypothetical protein Pint_33604 [Pistacia integerrima]